jgi:hypothetical protein
MELWVAVLGGGFAAAVVSSVTTLIMRCLDRKNKKEDSTIAALRIILYERIKYLGRHYIADGSIDGEDLEDLLEMHKVYHDSLVGNGYLDKIMAKVAALPIVPKKG